MDAYLGFLTAFGTAAAKSGTDIATKIASKTADELSILAAGSITSTLILSVLVLIRYPAFLADPAAFMSTMTTQDYPWVLALDGTLNAIALFFYIRAFKYADASLVAPLMLLTPLFLLVTSPLILGEKIPPLGIVGILFAVIGSYRLGQADSGTAMLTAFKRLAKDHGVQCMLVTVSIWSITSNLDKIGVYASTPLIWGASISLVITVFGIAFLIVGPKPSVRGGRNLLLASVPGLGLAAQAVLQNMSLTMLMVPYVITIKRTSAILTILISGRLLKEDISQRLKGAILMLLGTILMVFAS